MKWHRAVGLLLSLTFLLIAPRAFAGEDKEKPKKEAPAKQASPPPKQASPPPRVQTTQAPSGKTGGTSGQSGGASGQHGQHGQQSAGAGQQSTGTGQHNAGAGQHSATDGRQHGTTDGQHGTTAGQHGTAAEQHGTAAGQHGTAAGQHGTSYGQHGAATGVDTHGKTDAHSASIHRPEVRGAHRLVDREVLHERMRVHASPSQRANAFERSRVERRLFVRTATPIRFVPAHRVVLTSIRIVPTTYYYRRTVFYDAYGWAPPAYVYGMYPRYGLWDAAFLAFALDHIAEEQYALMLYNHRNEEDLLRWRRDTEAIAANDPDLQLKLDSMNETMASLDASGTAVDPSFVPADAQDVALSPEVIAQLTQK
jgi:hypothetical protein